MLVKRPLASGQQYRQYGTKLQSDQKRHSKHIHAPERFSEIVSWCLTYQNGPLVAVLLDMHRTSPASIDMTDRSLWQPMILFKPVTFLDKGIKVDKVLAEKKTDCRKMILRSFHHHNGISYTGRATSLSWIKALVLRLPIFTMKFPIRLLLTEYLNKNRVHVYEIAKSSCFKIPRYDMDFITSHRNLQKNPSFSKHNRGHNWGISEYFFTKDAISCGWVALYIA